MLFLRLWCWAVVVVGVVCVWGGWRVVAVWVVVVVWWCVVVGGGTR